MTQTVRMSMAFYLTFAVITLLHHATAVARYNSNDFALKTPLNEAQALALNGNSVAQWMMGVRYQIGAGVEQSHERALYWYRKSAEQGFFPAQRFLSWSYGRGENGLPKDHSKSMTWGLRAAKQGDSVSQLIVAIGYSNGLGVPINTREAVKWLRKAAMQGLANAQHQLAIKHIAGEGTPEDYVTGYVWMNLAAAQGIKHAKESRDALRDKILTKEQLADAHRLSRQLQRQIERQIDGD